MNALAFISENIVQDDMNNYISQYYSEPSSGKWHIRAHSHITGLCDSSSLPVFCSLAVVTNPSICFTCTYASLTLTYYTWSTPIKDFWLAGAGAPDYGWTRPGSPVLSTKSRYCCWFSCRVSRSTPHLTIYLFGDWNQQIKGEMLCLFSVFRFSVFDLFL